MSDRNVRRGQQGDELAQLQRAYGIVMRQARAAAAGDRRDRLTQLAVELWDLAHPGPVGLCELADHHAPVSAVGDAPARSQSPEWDARAQLEIGVLVSRYLADHPAPGPTSCRDDLQLWAAELSLAGEVDLQALGARRLQLAGTAQGGD